MKKTKILLFTLVVTLFTASTVNAIVDTSQGTNSGDDVSLTAYQKTDGTVNLSWSKYEGSGFNGYKVVHSTTEKEPVYPENGYLIYITDVNNTNYIHKSVKKGANYYRICVLTNHGKYCGNTITITSDTDVELTNDKIKADEYSDDENIEITLSATKTDNNQTKLTWTKYEEGDLKWYKIVRSQKNSMPYYPNDGHIGVKSYASHTTFTDEKPLAGDNYYRVCVITIENKRGCSNVVKVYHELSGEMPFNNYFSDTKDHWSREYVNKLAKKEIIEGIDGYFYPNKNVLRSEAIKMIMYAHNKKGDSCDASLFPDMKESDWFCKVATKAREIGIIEGKNGYLQPRNNVTRAEAVKILIETRGDIVSMVVLKPFPDVAVEDWHAQYVYHAKRLGFVSGIDGKFEPNKYITRAELAKIISISMETEVSK